MTSILGSLAYLDENFKPENTTAAILRNICVRHDVKYGSDWEKAKLISIFQSKIFPRRKELLNRSIQPRTAKGIKSVSFPRTMPKAAMKQKTSRTEVLWSRKPNAHRQLRPSVQSD